MTNHHRYHLEQYYILNVLKIQICLNVIKNVIGYKQTLILLKIHAEMVEKKTLSRANADLASLS